MPGLARIKFWASLGEGRELSLVPKQATSRAKVVRKSRMWRGARRK